jgi:hypothetical protein
MKPYFNVMLCAMLVATLPASAQTTAAQITGRITDPSGAVVEGVAVTAVNANTTVSRKTVSNELGDYTVPLLEPGTYNLSVRKTAFRGIERMGLTLHVNQVARIDFVMTLGTVTETVSVTADAPLLESSTGSLGAVIGNRQIIDLPLKGRNVFDLVFQVPGAQMYNRLPLPGNNIPLSDLAINGGPAWSTDALLDGIPNTSPEYNQWVILPSVDAVQEFKVETNNMSAEFGRTGGGVLNVSMRSGSNQIHGTLYDFLRNSAMDGNNWFNNATSQARPPFRYNMFGVSGGGPIRKDKTFFFANYEGLRQRTGRTFLFSVPTDDQRRGDFTGTLASNGQVIQMFDPVSTRQLPSGGYQRDPFSGNVIPPDRFNVVSKNILTYWPRSNLAGNPVTKNNNYISNESEAFGVDQVNARIDHAFSDMNRLFGRISWNSSLVTPPNVFQNIANPATGPQLFTQRNFALNDTHSFSAHTLATFRIGVARLRDHADPLSLGFDATQLGLPAYFTKGKQAGETFPSITVSGYSVSSVGFGTSSIGPVNGSWVNVPSNAYTAQSDITHMRGKHVIKIGLDYRLFRIGGYRPVIGSFTFNSGFTQGPDPMKGTATAGNGFASYLLGLAGSGSLTILPTRDTQSQYWAGFAQDDYKITPKLTLNIGLRFEQENLRTDRYNRLTYMDFNSPNPLKAPGFEQLKGGLKFVGVDGNPREQANVVRFFSPRFGFAYQLLLHTVFRGGYGIFVAPRTGFDPGSFGQLGYSATTNIISALDGVTPTTYISNPYPNGFLQPTGNTLGMLTNVGTSLGNVIDRDQQAIYVQQWNFDIQRSLPGDIVVVTAYAGSKGAHLKQNLQYNQLPDRYLSLGSGLQARVPNPFFGLIPATQPLGTPTVAAGQLLLPYPQFTSITTSGSTSGSSIYHSMQLRIEKRLSKGLSFLAAYTVSKLIDQGQNGLDSFHGIVQTFQNNNDRRSERSISSQDVPQRFTMTCNYELPFGKGKRLLAALPAWGEKLVGGWQINGIPTLQSGIPLGLVTSVNNTSSFGGSSRPNNNGKSAKLSGPTSERLNRYFDVSVFSLPAQYTFGNTGRTLPDVRSPGMVNLDLSLLKNTRTFERYTLQFRVEAFNVLNHPNFGGPNTGIGGTQAGVISSVGAPRIMQCGLKLIF